MNAVLDEQPPNNWDSFSLFQVLNDFLVYEGKHPIFQSNATNRRTKFRATSPINKKNPTVRDNSKCSLISLKIHLEAISRRTETFVLVNNAICNSNLFPAAENLCGGRFHHFILETFFPMLVRYLDLMESSIDQSLKKAFDKEKWIPPGQVSAGTATAAPVTKTAAADPSMQAICTCASTDELYWKLQALQTFFKQLNWPDKVYSSHLTTRLSKMAAEKIIDAVKRTMTAFLSFKRGKSLTAGVAARFSSPTDYLVPVSGDPFCFSKSFCSKHFVERTSTKHFQIWNSEFRVLNLESKLRN